MKSIIKTLSVIIVTFGLVHNANAETDPVKERKALMKTVGASLGTSIKMVKGALPYDAAKAEEALNAITGVAEKFGPLFVDGTDLTKDERTEASKKIWEDKEGFAKEIEALKVASTNAAEAAKKGKEALAAVIKPLTDTCSSCHQGYRVKKQ